jgi:hypothetical protein
MKWYQSQTFKKIAKTAKTCKETPHMNKVSQ